MAFQARRLQCLTGALALGREPRRARLRQRRRAPFPWRAKGPPAPATRADVDTVNTGYRRTSSQVLVRRVRRPTRASLDFAAYHANFMNADPPPEAAGDPGKRPDASHPFGGAIVLDSLTGSIGGTPLSAEERTHPLALPPLVELLASKHVPGADRLEDVVSRVRAESWGLPGGPQIVRQTAAEAYLHEPGGGRPTELWVKIELAPWFHGFSAMPDEDGDGFPEIYGRVAAEALGDPAAIARFVRTEYEGRALSPAEVAGWAHQLASYWYPSYNTDLVDARDGLAGARHGGGHPRRGRRAEPADADRGDARQAGRKGRVQRLPRGGAERRLPRRCDDWLEGGGSAAPLKLAASTPSPIRRRSRAPFVRSWPLTAARGPPGRRRSLRSTRRSSAGWRRSRPARRPSRAATAFSSTRARLPTSRGRSRQTAREQEPDPGHRPLPRPARQARRRSPVRARPDQGRDVPGARCDRPRRRRRGFTRFAGQVTNPFERKFLADLGRQRGRDRRSAPHLPRGAGPRRGREGAALSGARYALDDPRSRGRGARRGRAGATLSVVPGPRGAPARLPHEGRPFSRHGDSCSRLPEREQARYTPETLIGHQVVDTDGALYEDDPDSPVVLLGDSFTGVYQLMDCEHAGVSAHLAKELGYPIDLVMSYGGGPNVRAASCSGAGRRALGTRRWSSG